MFTVVRHISMHLPLLSLYHPSSLQAASKRFKITGTGKVVLRHPGKQHINEKKSSKRLSQLGKPHLVSARLSCSDLCSPKQALPAVLPPWSFNAYWDWEQRSSSLMHLDTCIVLNALLMLLHVPNTSNSQLVICRLATQFCLESKGIYHTGRSLSLEINLDTDKAHEDKAAAVSCMRWLFSHRSSSH